MKRGTPLLRDASSVGEASEKRSWDRRKAEKSRRGEGGAGVSLLGLPWVARCKP